MAGKLRVPAEWEPQDTVYLCWPHSPEWGYELEEMRLFTVELISKILEYQNVDLIHHPSHPPSMVFSEREKGKVELVPLEINDIWVRDYGPFFLHGREGLEVSQFTFNSYGQKFPPWNDDNLFAERLAEKNRWPFSKSEVVLEGGAIEFNGSGLAMATAGTLKGLNRNPHLTMVEICEHIKNHLGLEELIVLSGGLVGDHTDGHVDNVVRFVSSERVVMASPREAGPNKTLLEEVYGQLSRWRHPDGWQLQIDFLPSLDPIESDGELCPRSYLNFIFLNGSILVPIYGIEKDQKALEAFSQLSLGIPTYGVNCELPIRQGGSLHCMTRQRPRTERG